MVCNVTCLCAFLAHLVMTLENRKYGRDYLAALDEQLLSVVRAGG